MNSSKNTSNITISAGKLKGLRLISPPSHTTRPTKSIVRQSFFNTLGSEIVDCVFIEGFGGSGSMGIEALSRGASESVFFEQDSQSAQILTHNLLHAKQRDAAVRYRIYTQDFFACAHILQSLQTYTILYLDPPFALREGMEDIYHKCFGFVRALNNPYIWLIAFEGMSEQNMPQTLGKYARIKQKKFGKSTISYFNLAV
ncbi:16S rRNA (guanine(966)-N(2))-methyltransferase RsmD [uncultured Helicobacter sp.]|uniref:16S rRNA (guanine(966)-N(2))-methyltransferase RsmD n=1 Tax=uncultured Helicobacter sp. TaxID=175537 RepID=UPI00374F739F